MVYIVVEESLGFGGGGWETGYHIYIIRRGKVIKKIGTCDKDSIMDTLKFMLKEFSIEYKVRKIGYPPTKGENFCESLIKVLCKQSKKEMK